MRTAWSRKINIRTQNCQDKKFNSYTVLIYTTRPSARYNLCWVFRFVVVIYLTRLVIEVYRIEIENMFLHPTDKLLSVE
jgi:hypothetical protein